MRLRERIRLQGLPFPKPLPLSPEDLIQLFGGHGHRFENWDGDLVLDAPYDVLRYGSIHQILAEESLSVDVWHSITEEFDDGDYSIAPLWGVLFPEIFLNETDFKRTCSKCGRKRVEVDTDITVRRVPSKKAALSINGQFVVVRDDVRAAISDRLTGAVFFPFDDMGKYFYLRAATSLGDMVFRKEEVFDLDGKCERCDFPKFRMFFGPLRHPKAAWKGEDLIDSPFFEAVVYSPKAYALLHSFDKAIVRSGIVLFE